MKTTRITSGLAAAALLATGSFALTGPAGASDADAGACTTTEHWPASASGRPAAHPETDAVYVWHTSRGWRVRVNDPGADRAVFTGSVKVDGQVFGVGRHLESGAEGVVNTGAHGADFRFVNFGGVDGLNFKTRCSTTFVLTVKRNGVNVPADHVYVGASGQHPSSVPLTIDKA